MRTLAQTGEAALLRGIRRRSPAARPDAGDDAAIWPLAGPADLVVSQDALVEGKDWLAGWLTPTELGERALRVAISDLAAMGATPLFCLATVCAPGDFAESDLYAIAEGLATAGAELGCPLVGGDLSDIDGPLVINVNVTGTCPPTTALRRDGGAPGDLLCVTGSLGGAAAGLQSFKNGDVDAWWREIWKRPSSRLAEGVALREAGVRCAADISDGLLVDAGNLAQSSGCKAELWQDAIPVDPRLATSFSHEWPQLAIGGGEDFELVFAAPEVVVNLLRSRWDSSLAPFSVVGRLCDGTGVRLLEVEGGTELELPPVVSLHYR